ncbi:unnamed protein product [Lymnaea stagnalis]|uniref:Uncharacterized protein n=1 Tax=Lymnaea stagnalis TaxID=6523 RepID=A0AAV2H9G4_LYMST
MDMSHNAKKSNHIIAWDASQVFVLFCIECFCIQISNSFCFLGLFNAIILSLSRCKLCLYDMLSRETTCPFISRPGVTQCPFISRPGVTQCPLISRPGVTQCPLISRPGVTQCPFISRPGVTQCPFISRPGVTQCPLISRPGVTRCQLISGPNSGLLKCSMQPAQLSSNWINIVLKFTYCRIIFRKSLDIVTMCTCITKNDNDNYFFFKTPLLIFNKNLSAFLKTIFNYFYSMKIDPQFSQISSNCVQWCHATVSSDVMQPCPVMSCNCVQ